MTQNILLKTLLADYPVTRALKSGEIDSNGITFDFAPLARANKGFKPFVRELLYDAGELAIVTFLQAREAGIPLVLVPATISGRFQHHCIAYNAERGLVRPEALAGKRIGVRAYTQTTGMWVRGVLQNQFGADLDKVTWVTFEDAHVASYQNPPNVEIASEDKQLVDMLLSGELDAAMLGDDMPDDPRLRTVIEDPAEAAQAWYRNTGAISMNHMFVVTEALTREHPDVVPHLFAMLKESKARAKLAGETDMLPYGLEALRPSLDLAIKYCRQQKLLARGVAVEDLFNDLTIGLS